MPPSTPGSRAARLVPVRALAAGLAAFLAGCGPSSPPSPATSGTLVVAVQPGPATWFPGPDREPRGLDHDLIADFAASRGWRVRAVTTVSADETLDLVARGTAHVGAGGLFPHLVAVNAGHRLAWTLPYASVEPVLIHAADSFAPRDLADLAGARVAHLPASGLAGSLGVTRTAHPEIRWEPVAEASAAALIAQVDQGRVDFAVVGSNDAAAARHAHVGFAVAFRVGDPRGLVWAVPANPPHLREALDAYLARARADGTLGRIVRRYLGAPGDEAAPDLALFEGRVRTVLPRYRRAFQDAQQATGIDWRLLAAIAWQESQWDPLATSETGVRGIMQLTEQTAQHLGVLDRFDPRGTIVAAARYFADLKARLPARIREPDRTWLALAAFNIGMGHLEDARVLAQKRGLDPDRWSDVRQALPLLAEPEHHAQTRLGYARGGMPVAFVDRVRAFYDLLLDRESAWQPRLHVP